MELFRKEIPVFFFYPVMRRVHYAILVMAQILETFPVTKTFRSGYHITARYFSKYRGHKKFPMAPTGTLIYFHTPR